MKIKRTITLPSEVWDLVKQEAVAQDRNTSWVIADLIKRAVAGKEVAA